LENYSTRNIPIKDEKEVSPTIFKICAEYFNGPLTRNKYERKYRVKRKKGNWK
jgi:hypothetical protein